MKNCSKKAGRMPDSLFLSLSLRLPFFTVRKMKQLFRTDKVERGVKPHSFVTKACTHGNPKGPNLRFLHKTDIESRF